MRREGENLSQMFIFSISPLHLRERLRERPDSRLEAVPLFTVLLIVVLISLTASRFIFAPGVAVSLDGNAPVPVTAGTSTTTITLPTATTMLPGAEPSAVLTAKSDTMFIFDGHIYENPEEIFAQNPGNGGVLLVKFDRMASVQGLFRIAELAGKAGFASLQIAGESPSFQASEASR